MTDLLDKAVKIIVQVADPDKIILFGSRARGDFRDESDYDLFILKKGLSMNKRKLAQLIYRSLYGIGAGVDLIVELSREV